MRLYKYRENREYNSKPPPEPFLALYWGATGQTLRVQAAVSSQQCWD